MFLEKYRFSWKFYLGLFLVVFSLILGKVTLVVFLLYSDPLVNLVSIIIYILSWPMLLLGGWWVGKEYFDAIKKYASYKFYHQSLKRGTKMVVGKAREGTRRVAVRTHEGAKIVMGKTGEGTKRAIIKTHERTKAVVGKTREGTRRVIQRTRDAHNKVGNRFGRVKSKSQK